MRIEDESGSESSMSCRLRIEGGAARVVEGERKRKEGGMQMILLQAAEGRRYLAGGA